MYSNIKAFIDSGGFIEEKTKKYTLCGKIYI